MKILVLPFPLLAHYARCAELAHYFKIDGHEIVFAGGCNEAAHAALHGFSVIDTPQFDSDLVLQCSRRFDFSWLSDAAITRVATGYIDLIQENLPDLVITDASQVGRIACEATRTPHLSLINSYMSRHYAAFRGVPATHPASRYQATTPATLFRFITRTIERFSMQKVHAPFRALRRRLRIRQVPHYLDEYEGDQVCIVDDLSIFPLKTLPPHYSVLGPLFHHSGKTLQTPGSSARKRIVVSLGSSGQWDGLSHLAGPSFSEYEILLLGAASRKVVAPHITSIPFAPPEEVFYPGTILICHGGNGTVYQGLKHGARVLCYPSIFEQEWNVAQFEKAGLVMRLKADMSQEELLGVIVRAEASAVVCSVLFCNADQIHQRVACLANGFSTHPTP